MHVHLEIVAYAAQFVQNARANNRYTHGTTHTLRAASSHVLRRLKSDDVGAFGVAKASSGTGTQIGEPAIPREARPFLGAQDEENRKRSVNTSDGSFGSVVTQIAFDWTVPGPTSNPWLAYSLGVLVV